MASIFEKYPNLPGFATELKDGGLQVRTEIPVPGTDSILLLGTAMDGPVGESVAVDPTTVELVFGSANYPNGLSNGTTLVKAFYEAYQAGCRDIRLMRVTGKEAAVTIETGEITEEKTNTVSKNLGTVSGNVEATIELASIDPDKTVSIKYQSNKSLQKGSSFTVTEEGITLNANVVKGGEKLAVKYVDEEGKDQTLTYTAHGADETFVVSNNIDEDSLYLYANGVQLPIAYYKVTKAPNAEGHQVVISANKLDKDTPVSARFTETLTEKSVHTLKLESSYGGAVYNEASVAVRIEDGTVYVEITKPDSKKAQIAEEKLVYSSSQFPTLGQLVRGINTDIRNNFVRATIANKFEGTFTSSLAPVLKEEFVGGHDGLNNSKLKMFQVLSGTRDSSRGFVSSGIYQLLENYTVDTIIPLGVHADDELPGMFDNFAAELALACAFVSHRNHATTGVISTSSPDEAGLAAVQAHVAHLLESRNDYFMRDTAGNILKDADGQNMDLGRYISVVAGPDVIFSNTRTGAYADNSAAAYAGFVSQLAPQSAPTNKAVNYASGLRYTYSNAQLNDLTGARYVTFKYKNNGANVAIVDGPTAAQPGSDYARVSTMRVVKEVVNEIREVCDPYIGEPNELPQRNAMSAAISKRLELLQEAGVVVQTDFVVVTTPQMQLMGEAQIELTIVPPMELRKITTIVALTPGE